jgi:hypothetical protein
VILAHHFLVRLHQRLMARGAPPPAAAAPAAERAAERAGDLHVPGDCGPHGGHTLAAAGRAPPESAYRALLATGYLAATHPRSARGLGVARLPAPAPGGRLPLPPHTRPRAAGSPWLTIPCKVSLSCEFPCRIAVVWAEAGICQHVCKACAPMSRPSPYRPRPASAYTGLTRSEKTGRGVRWLPLGMMHS